MKSKNRINFKESKNNLKQTWKFAKQNKKYLLIYLLFYIVLCIIGAITPMLSAKQLLLISDSTLDALLKMSIFIFIVEITRNTARFFSRKYSQLFFRKTLTDIQIEASRQILELETKEIDNNPSGLFIERINRDTESIADIFALLTDAITDIVVNIGILLAILVINKYVFIYFVVSLIILFILNKIRIKNRFESDKVFRKLREKNTTIIGEMIRGLRDVKVLNADNNFLKSVEQRLVESNNERYKINTIDRNYTYLIGSIQDLITLGFIILAMKLVIDGNLLITNFVILYMYQNKVYNLLSFTTRVVEYLRNFNISATRVFEIIDSDKFAKEQFGNISLPKVEGEFEFKNVSFGYDRKNILKNLSFKINPNETVAFVGRSGAGKTTIFNLLTKLYHPKNGNIYIDGVNINNLTKDTIRNNISIITQNPYIFNFTIKENLKIVKEDATEKEIIEACKKASLHEFIMNLPDKYDTLTGEGGVNLSGGQRQRLAIARAFLKDTEIILLDEATSALDNETQREIQEAINNLKQNYTILIIAHRLSTVINSDRILVIDEGRVQAEGKHYELLKNSKLYRELYDVELEKQFTTFFNVYY